MRSVPPGWQARQNPDAPEPPLPDGSAPPLTEQLGFSLGADASLESNLGTRRQPSSYEAMKAEGLIDEDLGLGEGA